MKKFTFLRVLLSCGTLLPCKAARVTVRALVAISSWIILCAAPPARAQVSVANYTFPGNSLASSDTDPNSTASNITLGAGLAGSAQFITIFGSPFYGAFSNFTPATEPAAVTAADFLSFTVTPVSGPISYKNLSFNLGANANNISGSYTPNISVLWSVDGFTSILTTASFTISPGQQSATGGAANLSASPAQSGPVEFRFYLYDNQSEGSFTNEAIGNINLTAVPAPEPTSLALVGLGGFFFLHRRVRWSRQSHIA